MATEAHILNEYMDNVMKEPCPDTCNEAIGTVLMFISVHDCLQKAFRDTSSLSYQLDYLTKLRIVSQYLGKTFGTEFVEAVKKAESSEILDAKWKKWKNGAQPPVQSELGEFGTAHPQPDDLSDAAIVKSLFDLRVRLGRRADSVTHPNDSKPYEDLIFQISSFLCKFPVEILFPHLCKLKS